MFQACSQRELAALDKAGSVALIDAGTTLC
jgi:hypothetical protein